MSETDEKVEALAKLLFWREWIEGRTSWEWTEPNPAWEALPEDRKEFWRSQAKVAAAYFFGEGKMTERNAVATMLAALRKAVRVCIDVHRSATQNPALTCAGWCPSYTGACLYWKALRAAGEEVEGG